MPEVEKIRPRYASIDLLRGVALLSMLLVSSRSPFLQLRHGSWHQVTIADLVYPAFLLLVGVSMAISTRRAQARGATAPLLTRKLLRRIFWLYLIGSALTLLSTRRIELGTGTLQSIALASLIALPALHLRSRTRFLLVAALCSLQLVVYYSFTAPLDVWSPDGNAAALVDRLAYGSYRGVEGIMGSIFSALFVIIGLAIGDVIESRPHRLPHYVTALAAFLLLSGYVLSQLVWNEAQLIPVVARLISPSFFALASALLISVGTLVFIGVERVGMPRPFRPLAQVGGNPLVIFCAVKVFQETVLRITVGEPPRAVSQMLRDQLLMAIGPQTSAATVPIIKVLLALVIAEYLARKKLNIRL